MNAQSVRRALPVSILVNNIANIAKISNISNIAIISDISNIAKFSFFVVK